MSTNKHPQCEMTFVRHGETDWNTAKRIQGHADIPLNGAGLEQAHMLKRHFDPIPFSAVYCSDLSRAKTTAEIIAGVRAIPVVCHSSLRERNFGSLEGKHRSELDTLLQAHAVQTELETVQFKPCALSESIVELYQRVNPYLFNIVKRHPSQKILIVTHHGVIRSLIWHHKLMPGLNWNMGNCAWLRVAFDQNDLKLLEHQGIEPYDHH